MQISSIISLMSSQLRPGTCILPFWISKSSFNKGILHVCPGGGEKYSILLACLESRFSLSTSQSTAILLAVLPVRVLLSLYTRENRYLTLPLLHSLRDSQNLTSRLQSMVLGCLVDETGSTKYLWVVQGRLNTFRMVTFQDE